LIACEPSKLKKEAEGKANHFFSYFKQGDKKKLVEIYRDFGRLETFYKSESASISAYSFKDNLATVSLHCRFTDALGKLNERDILLFFRKDSYGQLFLYDSKGLMDFSEKIDYKFGVKTGCILPNDTSDQQIVSALEKNRKVFVDKVADVYIELKKDVRVTDWRWETLSASGKGIVVNNSRFDIPSLKYTVTFMSSSGTPITTYKGKISSDTILAGRSTSFSFNSANVVGVSTASIVLNYDDDLIFSYLASKGWTGKECEEYFKTHSKAKLDSINASEKELKAKRNKESDARLDRINSYWTKKNKEWDKSKAGKIQKEHPDWSRQDCEKIADNRYWIGMTIEMLKCRRGKPDSANPSNNGDGVQWQWCWDDYHPSCFYGGADGIITAYN
jgi:hypothetical protein